MTEDFKSNDELHWLAFRYVAGELAGDEQGQFERRLADDQLAREAVEHAFELRGALRIVASESLAAPGLREGLAAGRAYSVVAVVAACLLIALVWWLRPGHQDRVRMADQNPASDDAVAAAIALAWAEVHGWQSREELGIDATRTTHDADWAALAATDDGANLHGSEVQLPAWLLRATEEGSVLRTKEIQ